MGLDMLLDKPLYLVVWVGVLLVFIVSFLDMIYLLTIFMVQIRPLSLVYYTIMIRDNTKSIL